MVRVIVDDHVVAGAILHLESARSAAEFSQRADDLVPGNAELGGEGDDAERIADVLRAGHLECDFAEELAFTQDGEARGEILQVHVERAVGRQLGEAVAHGAIRVRAEQQGVLVVGAIDDWPAGALAEQGEDADDFLDGVIEVEVLLFDVEDEAGLRREERERAVALVRFDHEGLAVGPRRIRAEKWHLRADVVGWILVGLAQHVE